MKRTILLTALAGTLLLTGCGSAPESTEPISSIESNVSEETTATTRAETTQPTSSTSTTTKATTKATTTAAPEEVIEPKTDDELETLYKDFAAKISGRVPYSELSVKNGKKGIFVTVSIDGLDRITYFGNYIVDSKAAFNEVFSDEYAEELDVVLFDGINIAAFFQNEGYKGKLSNIALIDDRHSGESKKTYISSDEEICKIFPATREHLGKQGVDDEKLKIYEDVMEILNENMDRPEDELLAELAPNYGMTADELKSLLQEVMLEIWN